MKFSRLKTRTTETVLDELERIQERISERAHEMFRNRGAMLGAALDDWLAAERKTIWRPAVEVCQEGNAFTVEAALAGVEPKDLDVQVTPETLLIRADVDHEHPKEKGTVHVCEFQRGQLFRVIRLPAPIDQNAVKAEYRNGLLRITAPIAGKKEGRKVEVKTL